MDTTLARMPIGQLLDGRYRVESLLAHGGMATVYLGTDTRLDRAVALKIMRAELASDEDFVRRFVAEARSVARLSHPNVVTVYDQGADGRTLFLAMEYVPGQTLRDLLSLRRQLSPRDALDILEGVLAGLAAAHDAGIAHRDVKPENVLLGDGRTVKVADFGLARLLTGISHTQSGMLIGTAAYLAPEQVSGGGADVRTDVYAAGVMLFELLTGRQPHTGDTPLAVAYKHVNEVVPPPSSLVPGLPPALDALVALATSRDPDLRPADAGQFLRAVTGARGGLPLGPVAGLPPAPAAGPAVPRPAAAPEGWPPPPSYGARRDGTGPLPTQRFLPDHYRPAANNTLIVSGADDPYGTAAPGAREPRLQRLLFSRRFGYLALGVAAVLVIGLLGWWTVAGRYTTVPRVTGLSVAAARANLSNAGLTPVTGKTAINNQVGKGLVIKTVPAAGARLARGGRVTLLISAGPKMITMPQVTGQQLAAAQAAIKHAGLVPGKVTMVPSATIGAGIVIATDPVAGASWPKPKPVTLTVSSGPPIPDFVGQQKAVAEQWANANGVNLNEVQAAKSDLPAGTVTRQSPAAGSAFTQGQVITVYYSPGPPMVAIPNVDGWRLGRAIRVLHNRGFQVQVTPGLPFSTVLNYSPQGEAPRGSTITLTPGPAIFAG